MSVSTKTWPYGTTRRAMVLEAQLPEMKNKCLVQGVIDDLGGAHFLVGESCVDQTANDGDWGTLTFTEGGPTGGYWKFVKDQK